MKNIFLYLFLLIAGRSLAQSDVLTFESAAGKAPQLVAQLKLETVAHLSFIKEMPSYADSSVHFIIHNKLPEVLRMLDSTQQVVQRAGVSEAVGHVIATEVKYYYANAVTGDWVYFMNRGSNRHDFHIHFIDTIQAYFPLPTKVELDMSPAANEYLGRVARFRFWKIAYQYSKTHSDSQFQQQMGISYAALMDQMREENNELLVINKNTKALLPAYAWERQLNNILHNYCSAGQVQEAAQLLHFIQQHTSDRTLIEKAEAMFAPLKKAREQYATNPQINIRPDYKSLLSMDELLAPYKGKTVFIDMWGTWCPYCIKEMAFMPELKKRMADKDLVFLYIAQDEDRDDEKWRDFIFANNVTGEHVRKNAKDIGLIWEALGVPKAERSYPRYVIVDASGKVVVKKAERPGNGKALYEQLMAVLEER